MLTFSPKTSYVRRALLRLTLMDGIVMLRLTPARIELPQPSQSFVLFPPTAHATATPSPSQSSVHLTHVLNARLRFEPVSVSYAR